MDEKIKESTEFRRIKSGLEPGPITKFFNAINPQTSLGKIAGKDFHENSLTISLILLFTLISGIISTVMYFKMKDHNVRPRDLEMIIAVAAVSWLVFLNFAFLVFEATRLFNILLFIFIITGTAMVTTNLPQNRIDGILGITVIALATIPLCVLLYYYLASEGDEVVMLKTLERERKLKEDNNKNLEKLLNQREIDIKKSLTEDITSNVGIRSRVAQVYIDKLLADAKKPPAKEKSKDDEAAKKKKKEEEEKKKKAEE